MVHHSSRLLSLLSPLSFSSFWEWPQLPRIFTTFFFYKIRSVSFAHLLCHFPAKQKELPSEVRFNWLRKQTSHGTGEWIFFLPLIGNLTLNAGCPKKNKSRSESYFLMRSRIGFPEADRKRREKEREREKCPNGACRPFLGRGHKEETHSPNLSLTFGRRPRTPDRKLRYFAF